MHIKTIFIFLLSLSILSQESNSAANSNIFDIIDTYHTSTTLPNRMTYADTIPASSNNNDYTERLDTSTLSQLESIKEQLKSLRGEIEQLQFEGHKLNEKFAKFVTDAELRFSELSKNSTPLKNDTNSPNNNSKSENETKTILQQSEPTKDPTPETTNNADINLNKPDIKDKTTDKKSKDNLIQKRYQEAYSLIKNKDYKNASEAFEKFITDYPNTDLSGNAYYWLGEICTVKGDNNKAAVYYLKGYQANAKGSRASDNLLKLAKSLAKMDKKQEACTTLNKLKKEFPTANHSIQKQLQEEMTKLKCGS